MILDSGVCTIFKRHDVSGRGEKPRYERVPLYEGWYGELEFESSPQRPTPNREEVRIDARIRILDERSVKAGCEAILVTAEEETIETPLYKITRVYHGHDEESGELIADLSLAEVSR